MNARQLAAAGVAAVALVAGAVGYVVLDDDDSSAGDNGSTGSSTDTGDKGSAPTTEPTTEPETLAVVGDSFIEQSRDKIAELAAAEGLAADVRGVGGAAICNWDGQWEQIAENPPDVLVLSFAGNDIARSCFNPTDTEYPPEQTAARYRSELERVLGMFPDETQAYVVLPPPIGHPEFEARATAMREMYRAAVDDLPDLRLIDTATTLDPEGVGFVAELPCEPWDDCPPGGLITVRTVNDKVHLTKPAGAERYARAVIDAVMAG